MVLCSQKEQLCGYCSWPSATKFCHYQRCSHHALCWALCGAMRRPLYLLYDGPFHWIWSSCLSWRITQHYNFPHPSWHLWPHSITSRMDWFSSHIPERCCIHLTIGNRNCAKLPRWHQCLRTTQPLWTTKWHLQNYSRQHRHLKVCLGTLCRH